MPNLSSLKNNDQFQAVTADCFISLGATCRTARWLKVAGLRYCSLPFDWLGGFSLPYILEAIEFSGKSFYEECTEIPAKAEGHKYVIEKKHGIISWHDFPLDVSVAEYTPKFKETFERRCRRLKNILSSAAQVCFVCNRSEPFSEFVSFCKSIQKSYPNLRIYFVNVRDSEDSKIDTYNEQGITIHDICAKDVNERGDNKQANPDFWFGNEELWNDVCSKLTLSDNALKNKEALIGG